MSAEDLLARLYQEEAARMTLALHAYLGREHSRALAEDLVQETFISALGDWKRGGLPDNPTNWLYRVCRNKALNEINRAKNHSRADSSPEARQEEQQPEPLFLDHEIADSQLRMLFACCAPALSPKSQLMLTLKMVSGFRASEIAHCLGMGQEAVEKALQRSKGVLQRQSTALEVPFAEAAKSRREIVQLVLYLMYTEGYSASNGHHQIKKDLCLEAMRLTRALLDIPALACATTEALFALMLLHSARFGARSSVAGAITELEFQDRRLWDRELIQVGIGYLNKAAGSLTTHRYLLEAAIAAQHCLAPSFAATNWSLIYSLYQQLEKIHPSPFVRLNRCIALLYAHGAHEALAPLLELATHPYLKHNHLLQLSLAKAWLLSGNKDKARDYYLEALAHSRLYQEKEFISQKINELDSESA